MAASGPIQTNPRGLLGLMQLKNLGRNPGQFEDSVQSIVNLEPWWLRNQAFVRPIASKTVVSGPGAVVPFTTNPILVPENEVWWVEHFTVSVAFQIAADGITNLAPVIAYDAVGSGDFSALAQPRSSLVLGPGVDTLCVVSARDFWCPPGSQLWFTYDQVISAGVNVLGVVRRAALPI